MKSFGSNAISNEFVLSPHQIQYKVESHVAGKKDSYTKLFPNSNLNQAEIIAMKQEQLRLEEEMMKKKQLEEVNKKLKENIKNYKLNQKEKEIILKQNEIDKKNKIEKAKEYNKQLREKAIKKIKTNLEEENVDYETFSFNDGKKETKIIEREDTEREPVPIEKETFSMSNLNTQYNHNNIINIREDIDRMIKEKIQQAIGDVNLANFPDNINFNISNININQDINEELNKNVESVKEFRKTGLFSNKVTRSMTETKKVELIEKQIDEREEQNKGKNELEKRR